MQKAGFRAHPPLLDVFMGGGAGGYDTSSLYVGASAAIGYVWNLDEANTVDVSGKYLWSHLGGNWAGAGLNVLPLPEQQSAVRRWPGWAGALSCAWGLAVSASARADRV